jgi:hypothetical protein
VILPGGSEVELKPRKELPSRREFSVKFWMGHAGKDMSELYDKIRVDVGFRKEVAERTCIGFELPSIVPNFTEPLEEEVLK